MSKHNNKYNNKKNKNNNNKSNNNKKTNNSDLKIIFLGGVGEVGKNMTLFEYEDDIIVVDAGMTFPNEQMPGIDYVIPDFNYLSQNKEKIKGIFITHGHEDHIGALNFVLQDIKTTVYGSKLSIALINHKLQEYKIQDNKLKSVNDMDIITAGCFCVEFVQVNHSTPGSFALSITTPVGKIFFTGDFKIDHTPIDNRPINLHRISEIGKSGVRLLMMDSTNVERTGYSMSENIVYRNLDNIFANNTHKRLIVATFASNIHRVQQVIDCALKHNRKIAFSGRSMLKIADIAYNLKELRYPKDKVVDIRDIEQVPYDRLCIISTGTQGEPMSALTRMSQNDFKKVTICDTDTVILSASAIPGNERMIYNVINNLYRMGADVIYQTLDEVHVSGHACQEELKLMFLLLQPQFFIPIHGEFRHLKQHIQLAEKMGIHRANCILPELGYVAKLGSKGLRRADSLSVGSVLVDGSSVSDESKAVLRDRRQLAADGFVVAIIPQLSLDFNSPAIILRGVNISEKLYEQLKESIIKEICDTCKEQYDIAELKQALRKLIAKLIYKDTKKRPMVIPIIIEN